MLVESVKVLNSVWQVAGVWRQVAGVAVPVWEVARCLCAFEPVNN